MADVATPSMASAASAARCPEIAAPFAASARFTPKPSSSVRAVTSTSDRPAAEIRKTASSQSASSLVAAASVTVWNTSQSVFLKVSVAPLWTARFGLPQARATLTATLAAGRLRKRTKNQPAPPSRIRTRLALTSGMGNS